jgi:glutaredoxin
MNWHEFRRYHLQKYGPAPLSVVSKRYQEYKKSLMKIEIYSKPTCPYCVKAKRLLTKHGYKYKEYDVNNSKYLRDMNKRTNFAKTVPQIFINNTLVGGYDQLKKLF